MDGVGEEGLMMERVTDWLVVAMGVCEMVCDMVDGFVDEMVDRFMDGFMDGFMDESQADTLI